MSDYFKWLNPDRTTTYQASKWPVRAKAWTPDETPKLCESGWHLATLHGIGAHSRIGAVLWTAEGRGEQQCQDDKVAFTSVRLLEQVGTLDHQTAVLWAAECAERVLAKYEDRYPTDMRPREAIAAAKRWADDPTEANRNASAAASASASAAAYASVPPSAAAYAPPYASAAAAANAAAATATATATATAAYAAAAAAANAAAYAAAYASANAAAYAAAAATRQQECEWQSRRLLELM